MVIEYKRLTETAKEPIRGSIGSAGYDLYADITSPIVVNPNETKLIGTGLAMEIPLGFFGGIFARSGLATKQGLRPANCVGVVDSDYRGEIKVAIHNDSECTRVVNPQDRIAQLVVMPYSTVVLVEVATINDTNRGNNGFGSTGV